MAEEKWILQFNKAVVMGSIYNPGEKAAFTVKDAQMILNTEKVTDPESPHYGKPPAEVIKKLSAEEVERIEGNGQPSMADYNVNLSNANSEEMKAIKATVDKMNERLERAKAKVPVT